MHTLLFDCLYLDICEGSDSTKIYFICHLEREHISLFLLKNSILLHLLAEALHHDLCQGQAHLTNCIPH